MDPERLSKLLTDFAKGKSTVTALIERLRTLPFEDLGFASVDHHRTLRQGFPEVIFCEGKTPVQVVAIARGLLKKGGPLLATRVEPATARALLNLDRRARFHPAARVVSLQTKKTPSKGDIVIVT